MRLRDGDVDRKLLVKLGKFLNTIKLTIEK